ncbi:hypothetical protein BO70DRAFT_203296 [Aspergillus heteromorphus CBS 117.55]|uniref:Uncharacterized protein n=1 Tax=Aspergillus heteromorphus CBS 117.55 TaxID=1448321 RepID=A0A317WMP3_9EURO|nr:uncharacterized protein BO70DRAFT_203296 [Aspergillus heteromorphus CBS 117.55]PWY87786.1 hypothetical protein BO70DRAFT_203296 [Aspergillus heteromorphus CBS 117.55]
MSTSMMKTTTTQFLEPFTGSRPCSMANNIRQGIRPVRTDLGPSADRSGTVPCTLYRRILVIVIHRHRSTPLFAARPVNLTGSSIGLHLVLVIGWMDG